MIPQNTTEIIWMFSGTVVGLIICVAISAIIRQVRHNSAGSTQADRWEDATSAVMGFVTGDATRTDKFSTLLKREDSRGIVIEALSNVVRANPESAVALRHRSDDVALLRQWISDSLEDKDPGRRSNACEVVATLRLRACHGMVLAATGDDDANVRVSATRALCVLDPETAVGVLLGLIEREGSWAADLLADLLQRVPAKALSAVMQRVREWGATPALVKLLASCPSEVANTVLLGALETDNPELRARVAEAIQASSPQAVAALATLLTDPHEGTRLSAVRSLGRVSNPKALITLSSALSDASRLVRFAAAEGIAGTPGGAELLGRMVVGSDVNAAEAAELALWRLNVDGSLLGASAPGVSGEVVGAEVGTAVGVYGVSGAFGTDGAVGDGEAGDGEAGDREVGHREAGDGEAGDGEVCDGEAGDRDVGDGGVDSGLLGYARSTDGLRAGSVVESTAGSTVRAQVGVIGDVGLSGERLSVQLERLANQLEQSDLTFEKALASLLDDAAREPTEGIAGSDASGLLGRAHVEPLGPREETRVASRHQDPTAIDRDRDPLALWFDDRAFGAGIDERWEQEPDWISAEN